MRQDPGRQFRVRLPGSTPCAKSTTGLPRNAEATCSRLPAVHLTVTDLLVGLREAAWMSPARSILVMIDGFKALRAVLNVFGHPVIARCHCTDQNLQDRLPKKLRSLAANVS